MGVSVQQLLDSGVHFGHRVSRWNPKMAPYIHGKRNLIHILDLVETVKGLTRSRHFLRQLAQTGRKIVFIGTKRQIKNVVMQEAAKCEMPYVNERWLGGTLTNFATIRSRLKRLEELEAMIESDELSNYKKKEQSSLMREMRRIKKNLDGIRHLDRVPGAVVVIDPKKEYIAVREANRLSVPIIAILDTDCDPDQIDIPIPANDDAMKSVSLVLGQLTEAINEGKANFREGIGQPAEDDQEFVVEMKKRENRGARRPQQKRAPSRARRDDKPADDKPAEGAAPAADKAATSAPAASAPATEAPKTDAPATEAPAPAAAAPAPETPAPAATEAPAPATDAPATPAEPVTQAATEGGDAAKSEDAKS